MQALTFFFAFVAVLALIGVAAWLVRRFASNRLGANTNRGRMPRLAVIDAAAVDGRRRLVLVRRDNVEHLLMIGGPTDIVVEPNIVRATPGAGSDAATAAVAGGEPPPACAAARAGLERWRRRRSDAFDHAEPQMPDRRRAPARPSFADEMRRPAAPPLPERRSDPLAGFAPEPLGGRYRAALEPRPARAEPMPSRPHVAQASRPSRRASDANAPKRAAGARHRNAPRRRRRPPPAPAARPKSRRDGATAGSRARAGRRRRRTEGRRAAGRAEPPASRGAPRSEPSVDAAGRPAAAEERL